MNNESTCKNKVLIVGDNEQSQNSMKAVVKDDYDVSFGNIDDVLNDNSSLNDFDVIVTDKKSYIESINKYIDYDSLTGLYSKDRFFNETRTMLDENPDIQFVFVRFDINRFSLINSYYGQETGNKVLCRIASGLRKTAKVISPMTYGRINADIFGICMPFPGKEKFEKYLEASTAKLNEFDIDFSIVLIVGAYIIDEPDIPVDTMCVRATLAIKNLGGKHLEICSYYNNKMRINLESDQRIINEMNQALAEGQFVPYFQPKYDVITNKPVGAEALARWVHPTRGLVSPAEFIPVFERNGFISKLDFCIWEQVCQYLSKWKKMGLPLFPISVNVSRFNLYNPNLVKVITSLTEKYDVEPKYLNLELTESLYTEMNEIISKTTGELQSKGFVIMMDDFGSGYSSLNVLKDVPVDVLKMDMRFMSKSQKQGRAENILASVVRMAKWLNMPVVAEGVDKKEQVDFLRGVGCDFIQGFYYAKPMPADEYEKLISEQAEFINEENEKVNTSWNAAEAKAAIESSPLPTGIFEYFCGKGAEIISVNHAFYEKFSNDSLKLLSNNPLAIFSESDKKLIYQKVEEAVRTGKSTECVVSWTNCSNHKQWLKLALKNYAKTDISYIIIAGIYDITDERNLDKQIDFCSESIIREQTRTKNLLIISPDDTTAETIREFTSKKFNSIILHDCSSAFDYMLANPTDIIILDSEEQIPDLSDFVARVRKVQGDDNITIAVSIENPSPESRRRIFTLGADRYILKPYISSEFSF